MTRPRELARQLDALHEGKLDFQRFVQATRKDWHRLAEYLFGRWRIPDAIEIADIEQELLAGAWGALQDWREGGASLPAFVLWRAITAAKKWLHEQRNAPRRWDGTQSRFPASFSAIERRRIDDEHDTNVIDRLLSEIAVDPSQGERIDRAKHVDQLVSQLSDPDAVCVLAFVSCGTLDGAAQAVYSDLVMRVAMRIGCEKQAKSIVHGAVVRAAAIAA